MLDRERQAGSTTTSSTRASPPPTYHSNAGTLLRFVEIVKGVEDSGEFLFS